jgi:hypothetical protein
MRIHTIKYEIDWDKFKPYSSFFIPALNYAQAKETVLRVCAKRGFKAAARLSIEDGVRGVRVWRLYKSGD